MIDVMRIIKNWNKIIFAGENGFLMGTVNKIRFGTDFFNKISFLVLSLKHNFGKFDIGLDGVTVAFDE